ncbi:MAG TPA: DinB family protein [Ilumatobacter sp.]|nr:DinB family protein [Ilumatobacter sp.]
MTDTTVSTDTTTALTGERADLLETLRAHRGFLLHTAAGLTDEQARQRPTASELTIGGLIKHVAAVERDWADFMRGTPSNMNADVDWSNPDPALVEQYQNGFKLLPGETLAGVIAEYEQVAAATDELVATLDLDTRYPLPEAPWFPAGTTRSVRRVITHIVAETAQHSGHADIIRESIDGQRTMG